MNEKRRRTITHPGTSPENSTDVSLQTLFQSLIENSFDVILVVDKKGTTLYVSPSSEPVLGYEPAELVGNSALDLVHPDDVRTARSLLRGIFNSHDRSPLTEIRGYRKDGELRTFEVVGRNLPSPPFNDGAVVNYHDITDRKMAEEALRRSEERFCKAYHSCPASITISVLEDGLILEVNDGFERLSGYHRHEIVGKTATELNLWKNTAQRDEVVKRLMSGDAVRDFEAEFVVKEGDVRICSFSARVVELDGQRCMLSVVEDVSERKKAEAELHRATEELRRERKDIADKNAALKQILDHIEDEKAKYHHDLSARVENLLGPVITRLKKHDGRLKPAEIKRLEDALRTITETDIDAFENNMAKLTGRELDVCQFLKDGLSSKEIASRLGLSVQTIHKHRRSIRRKLQLANKDINLAAYLRSK